MPEPYFQRKSSGLILIKYQCKEGLFAKSTGEKIEDEKNWRKRNKRSAELNAYLDSVEDKLKAIILKIKTDGLSPTPELISKHWQEAEVKKNLLLFVKAVVDNPVLLRRKGIIPSPNRMKIYSGLYNHLHAFQEKEKKSYSFDEIGEAFYGDFVDYLQTKKQPLNDASLSKYIKALIAILNLATRKGLNTNMAFKDKEIFAVPGDDGSETIFLTEDEIQKVYETSFGSEMLARERDALVLGCQLGLRHGDFIRMEKHHFIKQEDGWYLNLAAEKTGEKSKIPVNALALEILEKYEFKSPVNKSNQKRNEAIKALLKQAKIEQDIVVYHTFKGKKIERILPKYKLASTHTLRRSCVTNLYLKGFPTLSIMKIWGWKSEKAFLRYIRVDQLMASKELMKFYHEQGEMLKAV